MGIAPHPSCVSLPEIEPPYPPLLVFLVQRFPQIEQTVWEERIRTGKVLDESGTPIALTTPYLPHKRLFYYREVATEPHIPWSEKILFQNDHFLVACKPPFLPVIPAGPYVNECLLERLRRSTGNSELVPLHRIDRETSGLVLFSANKGTRGRYARLFLNGQIQKSYEALAALVSRPQSDTWTVENRLVRDQVWFRSRVAKGEVNARSQIKLVDFAAHRARFVLTPHTGKKHQLRVHMSGLGFPILNDRYYPKLLSKQDDDLSQPLQLIARRLEFSDPLSGRTFQFTSERKLLG